MLGNEIDLNVDSRIRELIDTIKEEPGAELGFYDELAFLYDYLYGNDYDHKGQASIVDENTGSEPERILDVGCGTGRLIGHMAEEFDSASIDGLELHEGMANLAEERFQEFERIDIRQGDIFESSLEGKYDVITAFGVNPHFTRDQNARFFEIIKKLLAENGILVLDYKDPDHEVNGRYSPFENETEQFNIVSRFITVFKDGQSYYTCSYEFEDKETEENFFTGSLFEVYFHSPDNLRSQIKEANLEIVSRYTEEVDQSGAFIIRLNS